VKRSFFLPKNFSGAQERLQLQATHASNTQTLYWHLNDEYLGQTEALHQLNIAPKKGRHKLLVMDEKGNTAEVRFAVE